MDTFKFACFLTAREHRRAIGYLRAKSRLILQLPFQFL